MQTPESDRPKELNSNCPNCERHFTCDVANGCASCWCMSLPAVLPVTTPVEPTTDAMVDDKLLKVPPDTASVSVTL